MVTPREKCAARSVVPSLHSPGAPRSALGEATGHQHGCPGLLPIPCERAAHQGPTGGR